MLPRDGSALLIALLLLMVVIAIVGGIGWFALTRGTVTLDCSWVGGECGVTING